MKFSFKKYFYSFILLFVFLGIQSFDLVHECHDDDKIEQNDCEWCKNLNNTLPSTETKYTAFEVQFFNEFHEVALLEKPSVFLRLFENKGPPMI